MKKVLIFGAGRSAYSLIHYLSKVSLGEPIQITTADLKQPDFVIPDNTLFEKVNIQDEDHRNELVQEADLVISMVPVRFHSLVLKSCLQHKKSLITASYASPEIQSFHDEAVEKGITVLMECGLDPGIDHMSAMQVMDKIRGEGGEITHFETFTGGLLAPNHEDNPWEYKFTWNPRNVVLAGSGNSQFIQEGKYKYIPYHRLFRRTEVIHIPGHGYFEGYANRDSLKYKDLYQLDNIKTLYRGTLRRVGFCKAWDTFVQLGATEDSYEMRNVSKMTHRDFINSFLYYNPSDSVELKLAHYMGFEIESIEMYKLRWSGIFSDELVGLDSGTPAQILEHILKKKWTISKKEKDMIVMWHKFDYILNGASKRLLSYLAITGDDSLSTAMAKTVGLPIGIAAKRFLEGNSFGKGVVIPVIKNIYEPILKELKTFGINFIESEKTINA